MASRNYHKRRTKERKARQVAQRQERAVVLEKSRRRMLSVGGLGVIGAMAHAPKMFVRNGKNVPFQYLIPEYD